MFVMECFFFFEKVECINLGDAWFLVVAVKFQALKIDEYKYAEQIRGYLSVYAHILNQQLKCLCQI